MGRVSVSVGAQWKTVGRGCAARAGGGQGMVVRAYPITGLSPPDPLRLRSGVIVCSE